MGIPFSNSIGRTSRVSVVNAALMTPQSPTALAIAESMFFVPEASGTTYPFTVSGSINFTGGTNGFTRTRRFIPSGSLELSGAASLLRKRTFLPSGSIDFSGTAPLVPSSGGTTYPFTASGSISFSGGINAFTRNRRFIPSGSVTFSGEALLRRTRIFQASGGIDFSGAAGFLRVRRLTVSGDLTLSGGINSFIRYKTYVPSGEIVFSGTANMIFIPAGGPTSAKEIKISLGVSRASRLS